MWKFEFFLETTMYAITVFCEAVVSQIICMIEWHQQKLFVHVVRFFIISYKPCDQFRDQSSLEKTTSKITSENEQSLRYSNFTKRTQGSSNGR